MIATALLWLMLTPNLSMIISFSFISSLYDEKLNQVLVSSISLNHIYFIHLCFVDRSFELDIIQFVKSSVEWLIVSCLITMPITQPGIVRLGRRRVRTKGMLHLSVCRKGLVTWGNGEDDYLEGF